MIDIEIYLRGEDILKATKEDPAVAVITGIVKRDPDDLPYKTDRARWELHIEIDKTPWIYTANNKTLSNLAHSWGREESDWIGKFICLWPVLKDVFGNQKYVIYGAPLETLGLTAPLKKGK